MHAVMYKSWSLGWALTIQHNIRPEAFFAFVNHLLCLRSYKFKVKSPLQIDLHVGEKATWDDEVDDLLPLNSMTYNNIIAIYLDQ